MKIFKKEKQPVRLEKKKEYNTFDVIKCIIKRPEFWLLVVIILILIFFIDLALKESISYLVYNRGL